MCAKTVSGKKVPRDCGAILQGVDQLLFKGPMGAESANVRMVLLALMIWAGPDGCYTGTLDFLVKLTGQEIGEVANALEKLTRMGRITVVEADGRNPYKVEEVSYDELYWEVR